MMYSHHLLRVLVSYSCVWHPSERKTQANMLDKSCQGEPDTYVSASSQQMTRIDIPPEAQIRRILPGLERFEREGGLVHRWRWPKSNAETTCFTWVLFSINEFISCETSLQCVHLCTRSEMCFCFLNWTCLSSAYEASCSFV